MSVGRGLPLPTYGEMLAECRRMLRTPEQIEAWYASIRRTEAAREALFDAAQEAHPQRLRPFGPGMLPG